MKIDLKLALLMAVLMSAAAVQAQTAPAGDTGHGVCGFVDENGDGFNDLAPDADGDGIPNGLDPDYVKPADGTGMQHQYGRSTDGEAVKSAGNANGLAHYFQFWNRLMDKIMMKGDGQGSGGFGPGDGSGLGTGPGDGTGFGPGDGSGDCTAVDSRGARRGGNR